MKHPFLLFVLAGLVAGFSGCAALNEMQARQTEQSLITAGFKVIPANTAERQTSLAQLKPYQVNRKMRGGSVYYLYPNPKEGALYVGGQAQYNAYQGYQVQRQITEENWMNREMYAADSMGWGDWSLWGGGW